MKNDDSRALPISEADEQELKRLVNLLERREGAAVIFVIAPGCGAESGAVHPVLQQLQKFLQAKAESGGEVFDWRTFGFNPEHSLYQYLSRPDSQESLLSKRSRRLVMVFGFGELPLHRIVYELQQLNLGRETLFSQPVVVMFWLDREELLGEFRSHAQDFWDWREGKVFAFEPVPPSSSQLHPHQAYYPYLEWMMDRNRYLQNTGVLQVQKQVDMPLDQVYVSLQAERAQPKGDDGKIETEQDTGSLMRVKEVGKVGREEDELGSPRIADQTKLMEKTDGTMLAGN